MRWRMPSTVVSSSRTTPSFGPGRRVHAREPDRKRRHDDPRHPQPVDEDDVAGLAQAPFPASANTPLARTTRRPPATRKPVQKAMFLPIFCTSTSDSIQSPIFAEPR